MADASATPEPPMLRLPLDIYNRIFSYLISPSDTSSIHAILKTCRRLYNVALPLSVHTFRSGGDSSGTSTDTHIQNLQFLRYVLVTKPDLAVHVRTLVFMTQTSGPRDKDYAHEDESLVYRELWKRYSNPGESYNLPAGREEWRYSYHDRIEHFTDRILRIAERDLSKEYANPTIFDTHASTANAEASILLLACPRLQALCIEERVHPLLDFVIDLPQILNHHVSEASPSPAYPLQNLKEFYHESQDQKYGYSLFSDIAAPLFTVPGLRRYECVMANGSTETAGPFTRIPPRSSTVEEIYLRKSCVTAFLLKHMAASCKALKAFEYTRGVYHMYDEELMPLELVQELLPHASTLEYLYVNFEDDWDKGWAEWPGKICIGRELAKMTQLKTLVMGMQALTGLLDRQPTLMFGEELPLEIEGAPRLVESLPENLVHLEIHGCGKAILQQAQELLDAISAGKRFSKLERARFLFNAESITLEDVQLHCGKPSLQIDIVLQTKRNRIYDLAPSYHSRKHEASDPDPVDSKAAESHGVHLFSPQVKKALERGGSVMNICSQMYADGLREQWLEIRGKDIGSATVNEGLYRAPWISKTSPPHTPEPTD